MCRVLAYLGPAIPLADLLLRADGALVTQSIDPRYLHLLSLAGFGMMSWNRADAEPEVPLVYQSTMVPIYDANLASLARKLSTNCVIAHVRGVAYRADAGFGPHNLHPFNYRGTKLALAHNGDLVGFAEMKADLHRLVRSDIAAQVRGTTDSEWVYALLLSQLADPSRDLSSDEILDALARTLTILREVRGQHGIEQSSSLNLFLCDGTRQIALRFTFDYGCYSLDPTRMHEANTRFVSLWYTLGSRFVEHERGWGMEGGQAVTAALLASEPLTKDVTGWIEAPEYTAVVVEPSGPGLTLRTVEMDL